MTHPLGSAIRSSECYGRTDGLTKNPITHNSHLAAVDAGARSDEEVTLGEVIASGFMRENHRHPVIRLGERDEIPRHVRIAVWYRDHGQCAYCPSGQYIEGAPHLDHILPWSAGGPDTTDNLRLLCEQHNLERSNFVDHQQPRRPATWWCHRCYTPNHDWRYHDDGTVSCPRHPANTLGDARCRVARIYKNSAASGDPQTWHQRQPMETFTQIAYCAHCNTPGMTGVVL